MAQTRSCYQEPSAEVPGQAGQPPRQGVFSAISGAAPGHLADSASVLAVDSSRGLEEYCSGIPAGSIPLVSALFFLPLHIPTDLGSSGRVGPSAPPQVEHLRQLRFGRNLLKTYPRPISCAPGTPLAPKHPHVLVPYRRVLRQVEGRVVLLWEVGGGCKDLATYPIPPTPGLGLHRPTLHRPTRSHAFTTKLILLTYPTPLTLY